MTGYTVRWEIDIEADSPREAAIAAQAIQRSKDPANTATMFHVWPHFARQADVIIDLSKP